MPVSLITLPTPLGPLRIRGDAHAITEVRFMRHVGRNPEDRARGARLASPKGRAARRGALLRRCSRQLAEYFSGRRRVFRLPLRISGTPFRRKVYRALLRVPFGSTVTYGALARRAGRTVQAARAVGSAMRGNPLAILVPCHRVVPANGGIGAYAGGRLKKSRLLALERKPRVRFLFEGVEERLTFPEAQAKRVLRPDCSMLLRRSVRSCR